MQWISEGASPAEQPCALEAASSASGKEQLGMVSPTPTCSLSPPLPLSWGGLVWVLLLEANPLTQLLMVAPSSALSIRAFPQGSSLLRRTCLRCTFCTSPKCTLARWLQWGGRVLNPGGSLAGDPLGGEVLRTEGRHMPGSLGWWLQCLEQGECLIPVSSPRTASVFEPMISSPLEALLSSFA